MSANDYAEKVVNRFIDSITDYVFLSIEHEDNFMREYMENARLFTVGTVNQAIGKKVKELLKLEDLAECEKPRSRLITSYTRYKV